MRSAAQGGNWVTHVERCDGDSNDLVSRRYMAGITMVVCTRVVVHGYGIVGSGSPVSPHCLTRRHVSSR
jgi:hypothetical protein